MDAPTILVIVGITGDLSRRKLLPALGEMAAAGVLPKRFRVIGITRQQAVTLDDLLAGIKNADKIREQIALFPMSLTDRADYARLDAYLRGIGDELGGAPQWLWYLAVPPTTAWPIIEQLEASGLAKAPRTKLLLEKPFGVDEESARELVTHIESSFAPEQVYRIDHYLAKETVQNIVVFRRDNSLFERTWNRDAIERIDILASETIGIEGRTAFYEQTGALRDIVQSHLLQLAALTLMTLPGEGEWQRIPEARLTLLRSLEVAPDRVRRGQYEGYRDEVKNSSSTVETFASLTLFSSDSRWKDVPITLTTGKALAEKKTEIVITYRRNGASEANRLTLRLQPNEGVELCFFAKRPGYDRKIERVPLAFTYADHFGALPDAYEHVFLDAVRGDHTLFVSSEEVLESWRIIDAVRKAWEPHPNTLTFYPRGSTPEQEVGLEKMG
ncbi:MAG: glucose-6-phosphate dehydrogenase [Minisyncoccota bacterium]